MLNSGRTRRPCSRASRSTSPGLRRWPPGPRPSASGSVGSPWPCWTTRAEGPASLARDVLQAYLAMSDEPAGLAGDVDPPQLLGAALVEGDRFDAHPAGGHGPQEVGGVGEADRNLALIAHGAAGPDARRALDRGRVHAAVHDAPGRVVIRAELQVAGDAVGGDLVDDEAGRSQEGTSLLQRARVKTRCRRGPDRRRAGFSVHRRFLSLAVPGPARAGPGPGTSSWRARTRSRPVR